MNNFSWKSEEEWEDIQQEARPVRPRRWRRYWLWAGIIMLLFTTTAAILYWRVQETNEQVSAEVLSSEALIQAAAASEDAELFTTVLSGRSDAWVTTQLTLFGENQLNNRAILGFEAARELNDHYQVSVELDPDLQGAQVRLRQTYRDRFGTEFPLERTEIYRLGRERWLLAPPEDSFWGGWREFVEAGKYVRVRFPERDASTVWSIVSYVDKKIAELCLLPAFACPADFQIELVFHPDPYTLVQWMEPEFRLTLTELNVLPAPSLVGRPLDLAGLEASQRAYADLILTRVIIALSDYECCPGDAPLIRALLDRQLAQLGIIPTPVPGLATDQYVDDPFPPDPSALNPVVFDQAETSRRASLIVEFWQEYFGLSAGDLLVELAATGTVTSELDVAELNRFYQAFVDYNLQRQSEGGWDLDVREGIAAVCRFDPPGDARLVFFDPDQQSWQAGPVLKGTNFQAFSLAGKRLVWIADEQDIGLWDGRRPDLLLQSPERNNVFVIPFLDNWKNILFFQARTGVETVDGQEDVKILELDVPDCLAGNCRLDLTDYFYFWGPDDSYAIRFDFRGEVSTQLVDADGRILRVLADPVITASWWDGETFLYLRREAAETTLVRSGVDSETETDLITWNEIKPVIAAEFGFQGDFPGWVQAVPGRPNLVALLNISSGTDRYLVLFDWEAGKIEKAFAHRLESFLLNWSPDGRWLLLAADEGRRAGKTNLLIDMSQLTAEELPAVRFDALSDQFRLPQFLTDWSTTTGHLLQFNQGYLTVIDPLEERQSIVFFDPSFEICWGGGWVDW